MPDTSSWNGQLDRATVDLNTARAALAAAAAWLRSDWQPHVDPPPGAYDDLAAALDRIAQADALTDQAQRRVAAAHSTVPRAATTPPEPGAAS